MDAYISDLKGLLHRAWQINRAKLRRPGPEPASKTGQVLLLSWYIFSVLWCLAQVLTPWPNQLLGPLFLSQSSNVGLILAAIVVGIAVFFAWISAIAFTLTLGLYVVHTGLTKLVGSPRVSSLIIRVSVVLIGAALVIRAWISHL